MCPHPLEQPESKKQAAIKSKRIRRPAFVKLPGQLPCKPETDRDILRQQKMVGT